MRLSIRTKLLGGFGTVVSLLLVVAVMGITGLASAVRSTDALYGENLLGVNYAL